VLVLQCSGTKPGGGDIHLSRQDQNSISTLAQLLNKDVSKATSTSNSYSHCIEGVRTSSVVSNLLMLLLCGGAMCSAKIICNEHVYGV
jgi:hypothetical protein